MVSEVKERGELASILKVLILVVVEDGLGAEFTSVKLTPIAVLILVVVEDGLGDHIGRSD